MKVSVYIPTRNRLDLLTRAVDSVLAQTYPAVELIVVNDGSSDGTAAYLNELQARDPRVTALHNGTSLGAPASRNRAIRQATGEFITGLDDDDSFHPERIGALVEYWRSLEQSSEKFSCLYTQDILSTGTAESVTAKPALVRPEDLFFQNYIGNQIFTRRDYLVGAGLFDEEMPAWQDLDSFIRVLQRYGPAKLLDRELYILSVEPRPDRISMGGKLKIVSAYRRLSKKWEALPSVMKQGLFLQVFGKLYGFTPGLRDLPEFFRHGIHVRTLKSLAGIFLRRALGR